jgi:hypothetical protein
MNTLLVAALAWAGMSVPAGIAIGCVIGRMGEDLPRPEADELPAVPGVGDASPIGTLASNSSGATAARPARRRTNRATGRRSRDYAGAVRSSG